MLFGVPTNMAAGIKIYGDYFYLKSLSETIHYFCEGSNLTVGAGEFVLGLAYEIRQACQKNRFIDKFGFDDLDETEYRGTQVFWPALIVQVALLRSAAGSKPTNHAHQADLYRLENIVVNGLAEVEPKIASNIVYMMPAYAGVNTNDYLFQYIDVICQEYVMKNKTKMTRFKSLIAALDRTSPNSDEYLAFQSELKDIANKKKASSHELQDWSEWGAFEW